MGETVFKTNADDINDARKQIESEDDVYRLFGEEYKPIKPPICFFYIYSAFQELYNGCKEKITFQDIECYQKIRKCNFSQYEIDLIHKMSVWANEQIHELEERSK